MKIRRPALMLSLVSLLPSGIASAEIPYCGGREIKIGDGFSVTMYMFNRSSAFDLEYAVPDTDVRAEGIVVASKPIKLTFRGLDTTGEVSPSIGYSNLDLRSRRGQRFEVRAMHLDCSNGIGLSASFSGGYSRWRQPLVPLSFDSPFFSDRTKIPAGHPHQRAGGRR